MKPNFLQSTWAIVLKDLRAEVRSRELMGVMLLFSLLSIIVFSFALELDREVRREAVSGVLWVTVVFASVLGLNRSMALERENGSMDALLLSPISRASIFAGKFIGNYLFTLAIGVLLLPIITLLYNVTVITPYGVLGLLLGTWGISVTGTLLSAMTVQARAGEALLPIALLPVVLPIIMAVVRATNGVLSNAPVNDWIGWFPILLLINVVYSMVCIVTFGIVVEE